jgi:hypothetical protein
VPISAKADGPAPLQADATSALAAEATTAGKTAADKAFFRTGHSLSAAGTWGGFRIHERFSLA